MEFNFILRVLKFKTQKAFTLIEVLVVITIIIILSVIMLANYRAGGKELALQRSAHKLAQDIKRAQGMAMAAKECETCPGGGVPKGGYGVYIRKNINDNYLIYADDDSPPHPGAYSPGEEIETVYLEKGVYIDNLEPSSAVNFSINFKPPDPTINIKDQNGNEEDGVTITLRVDSTIINITVNKAGLIEVTK